MKEISYADRLKADGCWKSQVKLSRMAIPYIKQWNSRSEAEDHIKLKVNHPLFRWGNLISPDGQEVNLL